MGLGLGVRAGGSEGGRCVLEGLRGGGGDAHALVLSGQYCTRLGV